MFDLQARITELQSMAWGDIRAAAENAGFEGKPDEALSWKENAALIAQREMELSTDTTVIDIPTVSEVESTEDLDVPVSQSPQIIGESFPLKIKGTYNTARYKAWGIPVCPLCGEKELSDSVGNPFCPESFSSDVCPRLSGES